MVKHIRKKVVALFIIFSTTIVVTTNNYSFADIESKSLDNDVRKIAKDIKNKLPINSTVLILDFEDINGFVPSLGRYLADKITIHLATIGEDITIIGGRQRDLILKEQQFQISEYVDEETSVKISTLTGANHIIQGMITEFDRSVDIDIKILNVEKGSIVGGLSHKIQKNREITKLLKQDIEIEESKVSKLQKIEKEKPKRETTSRRNIFNSDSYLFGIKVGINASDYYDTELYNNSFYGLIAVPFT